MKKYGLAISDPHSGHLVGLTPPEYQLRSVESITTKRNKFFRIQQDIWNRFDKLLNQLPPIDFFMFMGDMIDGKGKKSGGTEEITTDMGEQVNIACAVIDRVRMAGNKKSKMIGVYGTDYHVGTEGDEWENKIAETAQFDKIGAHEWLDVNGLIFDLKHFIGNSSVPTGRFNAPARDGLWNDLWSLQKMQPRADIILRGHVHEFRVVQTSQKVCMTLPALQGMGSKFGAKICSGTVDWGMVLFEVKDRNDFNYYPFISSFESQKARVVKI